MFKNRSKTNIKTESKSRKAMQGKKIAAASGPFKLLAVSEASGRLW
jgi:hypothetical protein